MATSSSTQLENRPEEEDEMMFGAESGWVEPLTSCDHLVASLSSDLAHIPTPDTPCNRCQHPSENWLCLCCKEVLCSRFVNKHMLQHYLETNHSVALSYSMSKEFMNTQSLVRHAFMSHKVGLRAMHLGLQKAICVLMGWNSVVPHDMITWVPDVLHDEEAMAQKEDLILWPPVVIIRNISMSNNNPKEQKVVPIEGVEAFLRGEGFIGGKITVCLGRPADQSVMVVKFLGTFTGLGNAEKLHKYFVEHKHGRAEFVQLTSSNSRSSINVEAQMHGDKLEEQLLYGYMGVSEDLDSVDFNTKKYCFIKSKKEILDLANAPVKPD